MIRALVEGLQFPEGPVWSERDGCLYFTEWLGNRVWAWRETGAVPLFELEAGSGPSGLAQDAEGNLWACLYDARELARISPQGELLQIIDAWHGQPFKGICDLALDPQGGVYFSDSGDFGEDWQTGRPAGAIYYLGPAGELKQVDDSLRFPNGVAVSPDGRTLYVDEHRANRVLAYDILPGGSLSGRRVLHELDSECLLAPESCFELGPDGLCLDHEGSLWVAHYGGGKLVHIGRDDACLGEIRLTCGRKPTNAAYRADRGVLYVTEAELGIVYLIEIPNA
ncbi:MAG: SMP-30/gluconolactonase/LRE family protein [Anaerolineales bacterium]|nr:SMP-30/gluconolactonase/LRE family protein [Anaerolineales bacterium]